MSDGTKIEWTDATWNPVTGCTKISEGCTHCYIARTPPFRMAGRRFEHPEGPDRIGATTGVQLHPERLGVPRSWRKPRRIFVCSLADLFHAAVPELHIAKVFAAMHLAPQHTFQILTKRSGRMRSLLSSHDFRLAVEACARTQAPRATPPGTPLPWPLPNVWIGVSAETQRWADIRVPDLLGTPAAVRWVSAEPLLGPLDLAATGLGADPAPFRPGAGIDWVVAGGESGPGARPMHPDWARGLRDQCAAADAMSVEADRLDALDREASAGPWRVDETHGRDITGEGWSYYGIHAGSGPRPQEIAEMRWDDHLGGDDGEPRKDADLIVHRRNTLACDAAVLRATAEMLRDSASNIDCAEADRSPDDTSEITDVHALAVARAFTEKESHRG